MLGKETILVEVCGEVVFQRMVALMGPTGEALGED